MSELRKYATGALFLFPLVEDGDADFVNDYTPAAGDAKVFTDTLISTNLTSLILGFDSLSELPVSGAQIDENGAGTAEGVVEFTVITSGTVGGGDAAGFFFMRSVTGQAWSNNDQIDINGGTANIATADSTTYDLAATAGLIGDLGNGNYAAALSPTEMTCTIGSIHIVDSATKTVEDQAIRFNTYGNASALHAMDFDDAVRGGMTALPNAAADAAGGLPISDLGGLDADAQAASVAAIEVDTGTTLQAELDGIQADTEDIQTQIGTAGAGLTAINLPDQAMDITGNITGNLSGSVGSLTGHTNQTADHTAGIAANQTDLNSIIAATITNATGADIAADIITVDGLVDGLVAKLVGITLLNEWLGAIAGKQNADATALTELRATGAASGTYDPNTDSVEAVRDRGDAAWTTATGFNTTTPPTVAQIQTEMEENGASLLDTIRDELANGADGLTALKTAIDAIPTTAMRGTDSAALASEVTSARMAALTDWIDGGRLDLLLDAIKAVTDQFAFTKANEVDANAQSINGASVVGDGNTTPWDGA